MGDENKADKDNIMNIRREDKQEDTSLFISYELDSVITKSFDLKSMTTQTENLGIFDIKKGTFREEQHSFNAIYSNSLTDPTLFEPRYVSDSHINTIASSIQSFEEQISHLCRMSTEAEAYYFKNLKFKQRSFRVSEPDHLSLQLLQGPLNDGLSRTRYQGQLLETPEKHHEDSEGAPENYSSSRDNFDKGKHFSSNNNQATKLSEVKRQQTPGLDSPLGASERTAEQERLELGKDGLTHWTLREFRPRDSVKPRPRHSDRPGGEPPTIPADLRQRMQQRNYRIASMLHLGSSLPLGVVELADAGLYYDEDTDEMCCCNCSWRMSRRDFCNFRDPANTHLCSLNTEGDVTTNQGWEADKENDQTARMPEANHQPAEDDDGISSSDVDNYKSRPTSPPDLCLKQRYGTDTASKCDLETDGEKGNEEVAETHTSSLDRGSPVGPTHLRSGLDAASATSEEDRVFESPTWDEHVGSGSGTHGVNAGITQETHDGNDNAMHNIHSAVQNALENNDDAESVTQDAQSDSDTTTLGAQSGGDKFSY